ncbi:MAG: ABC transporter substrate-binding protein [Methanosarcinaceae archaeon]
MKANTILFGITMLLLLTLPAAASDYTLGVFGNANEDDTINMQDVTYTELIILEYRDETELADGKHDGKINMQDVTQIELIILGKEKELTVIDSADKVLTVHIPVERIVVASCGEHPEALRILDAMDRVVGVSEELINEDFSKAFYPEFQGMASIGKEESVDYEAILSLYPDVVLTYSFNVDAYQEFEANLPGAVVIGLDFYKGETMFQEMETLGYILGNREQAQKYINFVEGYENAIKEKVETLPEDEYPTVFVTGSSADGWKTWNKNGGPAYHIRAAGGKNIAEDLAGTLTGMLDVDQEFVIDENPKMIVRLAGWDRGGGYGSDDSIELSEVREEMMTRPGMEHVDAAEDEKVYILTYDITYHPGMIVAMVYLYKWFYPELSNDLDPQAIHQEYLDEFHETLGWNVYEHGVFVYPPLEES